MRRTNPWPAFVDLFSALLLAAFGGLMLLSAAHTVRVAHEVVTSDVRAAADLIHKRLRIAIAGQTRLKSRVRDCGDDTCVDLYIHFPRNENVIADDSERAALRDLATDLRRGLDQLTDLDRGDVEIIVEGHADRSQVVTLADPRAAFLYNWNLSARRASSVVYEFRGVGLRVPQYKIVAIGYADSQPLCPEMTDVCEEQNRRTTLRLRIDTRSVEKRLQQRAREQLDDRPPAESPH
jgi:outer membrane protein OmpA-like peptidoglycan-associated protein